MTEQYYFTKRGLEIVKERMLELEAEVNALRSRLAEAVETGGNEWHDNASYEQLTADIRILDRELAAVRETLRRAQLVEPPTAADTVCIGTTVKLQVNGTPETWRITGYGESDPARKAVAYNTPFAQLVMGKRAGETVKGNIAGRTVEIKILEITRSEED